jgi:hypothetical protein
VRLGDAPEALIIQDISDFYHKMSKKIEKKKIVIPRYDTSQKYESGDLEVRIIL